MLELLNAGADRKDATLRPRETPGTALPALRSVKVAGLKTFDVNKGGNERVPQHRKQVAVRTRELPSQGCCAKNGNVDECFHSKRTRFPSDTSLSWNV